MLKRLAALVRKMASFEVPRSAWVELLPLCLPLLLFPWMCIAVRHYADCVTFRDVNLFTYAAYCFRHGERMYSSFITPDGPLIYVIGAAQQIFWGPSAHDFRVADLEIQATFGALVGFFIAPPARDFIHGVLRRLTWTLVGATAWLVHVLSFEFTSSLQREGYYAGIGCVALALAYGSRSVGVGVARVMLVTAGAVVATDMFGKQTGVIYVAVVLFTAYWLAESKLRRRERMIATLAGVALGTAAMLLLVVLDGSLRGFWDWYFRYNFTAYRFMWRVDPSEILASADRREYFSAAGLAFVAGIIAIRGRYVSPAVAGFAVMPLLHVGGTVAQMHAWRYQFVPISATATVCFVVLMSLAWCLPDGARGQRTTVAIIAFVFFGARIGTTMVGAPFLDKNQATIDQSENADLRAAGEYIAIHTRSTDRVYFHGADPLVVYAARRLPALPYLVPWLVDLRAAAGEPTDEGRWRPTPKERDAILALQATLLEDRCRRITTEMPPAIVLQDMGYVQLGYMNDLDAGCPAFHDMLAKSYHDGTTIGRNHVYLRNDRD